MKNIRLTAEGLVIVLAGCLLAGCAAAPQATHSGFLRDYPPFQPGPSDGVDLVYTKPGVDLSNYRRIMVDEVRFYLKKDAAYQGIQADELTELTESFHHAVFENLGSAYPVVAEPGADVLRIRLAITDIEPSKPAMTGVTAVMPVGLAISTVKRGVTGSHTGVGGASMEAEFLDSMTNEQLVAGIDTFNGSKISGFTKLGATKEAFEFWAKRLRTILDKVHGVNK